MSDTTKAPDRAPLAWACHDGIWAREPDPAGPELEQGGHDAWLSGAGYVAAGEWFGGSPAVIVYERQAAGEAEWRIEVALTAAAGRDVIIVRRLPDLLDVLAKLAVIATADEHGRKLAHGMQVTYPYTGETD